MTTVELIQTEEKLVNQIGQEMGNKGQRTRRNIIDKTIELLEVKGLRDIKVADIARAAKTSTATFYIYFDSVKDVALAASEEISQSTPELLDILNKSWTKDNAIELAREFIKTHFDFWQKHRTIFLVRNMLGDEGDTRFYNSRVNSMSPAINILREKIAQKGENVSPYATAGAIIAMIERLASVRSTFDSSIFTNDEMIDAAALIMKNSII